MKGLPKRPNAGLRSACREMLSSTFFDEFRRIPVTFALPRKESFQMSGNDTIEGIFFGIARPVDVLGSHEAISGCKLQCITPTPSQQQLARLQRGKIQLDRD